MRRWTRGAGGRASGSCSSRIRGKSTSNRSNGSRSTASSKPARWATASTTRRRLRSAESDAQHVSMCGGTATGASRPARRSPDQGGTGMRFGFSRLSLILAAVPALALALPAMAADAVKIGLIVPMTGGQASTGKQLANAVQLYVKQHGDTVAGRKIEVILRDDAANPET